MTESDAQLALARKFDWFRNLIVPNAYLGFWEMDVAVVTPSGYLWEVEVKLTKSDWKADLKKEKWEHFEMMLGPETKVPSRFYYCVPPELVAGGIPEWVPEKAGVLVIRPQPNTNYNYRIDGARAPKRIHNNKLDHRHIVSLYRKIYARMWPTMFEQGENAREAAISA